MRYKIENEHGIYIVYKRFFFWWLAKRWFLSRETAQEYINEKL